MSYTTITTPAISESGFKELTNELLNSLVNGDTSPFKDAQLLMADYLDNSDTLSDNQKASAYSEFLTNSYKEINSQAMTTAMDLLKSNEQLKLEKYKTEAEYNAARAGIDKTAAETALIDKNRLLADKNLAIAEKELAIKELQAVETRAKLKKQYGVVETSTQQIGDGTSSYKAYTDGIWYKIRTSDNAFVKADGTITTTPNVDGVPAIITGSVTTSEVLEDTTKPGAIDKQILGYDLVNIKDIIKTMDQKAALMQNAKQPENGAEKKLRMQLIGLATNTDMTNAGFDTNGNIDPKVTLKPAFRCTSGC